MATRHLSSSDDFAGLCRLTRAFFAEYEKHNTEIFGVGDLTDAGIRDYFLRFVDKPDCLALMEERDGRDVAYLTVSVTRKADVFRVNTLGNISGLMVDKNYRRQGIATALMRQAIEFFRAKGVQYYTLCTAVQNSGAVGFYKSLGMYPLQTVLIGSTGTAVRSTN